MNVIKETSLAQNFKYPDRKFCSYISVIILLMSRKNEPHRVIIKSSNIWTVYRAQRPYDETVNDERGSLCWNVISSDNRVTRNSSDRNHFIEMIINHV